MPAGTAANGNYILTKQNMNTKLTTLSLWALAALTPMAGAQPYRSLKDATVVERTIYTTDFSEWSTGIPASLPVSVDYQGTVGVEQVGLSFYDWKTGQPSKGTADCMTAAYGSAQVRDNAVKIASGNDNYIKIGPIVGISKFTFVQAATGNSRGAVLSVIGKDEAEETPVLTEYVNSYTSSANGVVHELDFLDNTLDFSASAIDGSNVSAFEFTDAQREEVYIVIRNYKGCGKDSYLFMMQIDANVEVSGNQYTLDLSSSDNAAGTVSVSPSGTTFTEGTELEVTAAKNFGYAFSHWADAEGNVVSTENPYAFAISANTTLTAVFESVPTYSVEVLCTNNLEIDMGSVDVEPASVGGRYEQGTTLSLTARQTPVLRFAAWTDDNENASVTTAQRSLTVTKDMTIVADYEIQDFIAIFNAEKVQGYATNTTYPFAADYAWDASRNAKASVVRVSDGTALTATGTTPVVRNRTDVVVKTVGGLYTNGYRSTDIALQYQFSTRGFTSATFAGTLVAKNAACVNWKAQVSTDGTNFADIEGAAWELSASKECPVCIALADELMDKDLVYIRLTGTGSDVFNTNYEFSNVEEASGLSYTTNSEQGFGNLYILGTPMVVADEEAPTVSRSVPANGDEGISASGRITVSFSERIAAGTGTATLTSAGGSVDLVPAYGSQSVSFDYMNLDYSTAYTVRLPAGFVTDRSGNALAADYEFSFTTMARPTVTKGLYDFVVGTDGTLAEAIAAANANTSGQRFRIFVPDGEYDLGTGITSLTAPKVSIIGQSVEGTIIYNLPPVEGIGVTATICIESAATDCYMQDLTIQNRYPYDADKNAGRAVALQDKSTRSILKNVCLLSYQDTYYSNNNSMRSYFETCEIHGVVDFICGGDVFFENSLLYLEDRKGNVITAHSGGGAYGYVFSNCTIDGTSTNNASYTLGRPWGNNGSRTVYLNTTMKVTPAAAGWADMGGVPALFAEYNSRTAAGAAVDCSNRKTYFEWSVNDVPYSGTATYNPVLTDEEAAAYTVPNVLAGDDSWLPTLYTEQAAVPDASLADGVITWTADDYAFCYAVTLDGEVVAFVTEPAYTCTVPGTYTIRAANERGGLSAPSAAIEYASTGIGELPADGADVRVYGVAGAVVARNAFGPMEVYTIGGSRVASLTADGDARVALPAGIYAVRCSGRSFKVVVR